MFHLKQQTEKQTELLSMDSPGAVCILMLILLPQNRLPGTRSEAQRTWKANDLSDFL